MAVIGAIAAQGIALVGLAGGHKRGCRQEWGWTDEEAMANVLREGKGQVPVRVPGVHLHLTGVEQLQAGNMGLPVEGSQPAGGLERLFYGAACRQAPGGASSFAGGQVQVQHQGRVRAFARAGAARQKNQRVELASLPAQHRRALNLICRHALTFRR